MNNRMIPTTRYSSTFNVSIRWKIHADFVPRFDIGDISEISVNRRKKVGVQRLPTRLPCIFSQTALHLGTPKINRRWPPRYFVRGCRAGCHSHSVLYEATLKRSLLSRVVLRYAAASINTVDHIANPAMLRVARSQQQSEYERKNVASRTALLVQAKYTRWSEPRESKTKRGNFVETREYFLATEWDGWWSRNLRRSFKPLRASITLTQHFICNFFLGNSRCWVI